jgi:hypothetical protein
MAVGRSAREETRLKPLLEVRQTSCNLRPNQTRSQSITHVRSRMPNCIPLARRTWSFRRFLTPSAADAGPLPQTIYWCGSLLMWGCTLEAWLPFRLLVFVRHASTHRVRQQTSLAIPHASVCNVGKTGDLCRYRAALAEIDTPRSHNAGEVQTALHSRQHYGTTHPSLSSESLPCRPCRSLGGFAEAADPPG